MIYIAAYYLDGTTRYFADRSWEAIESRLAKDPPTCGTPTRTEQITAATYDRNTQR